MDLTRREWNRLVAAGLVAGPLSSLASASARQTGSRVAGVRIGVQSYSFRDRSLDEAIAAMKEIGLSYCELWSNHVESRDVVGAPAGVSESASRQEQRAAQREHVRRWRLSVPLDHFRDVRRRFDAAGVTLTAYNLSFGDDSTDDEIRRGFEMATALGVDVITASSSVSIAKRLDPFAREAGVAVAFHNHSRIAPDEFATPDDFAAAMVSDRMAVNLDIGHFTAANFDAVAYLEQHHGRIVSLHLKDRRRDQGPNVAFGEGDTPIAAVLTLLRDRKWDIPAHIEYEYRGEDTIAEVRRSLAYCRQVLTSDLDGVGRGFSPADRSSR
jgi:sugar phosphate isomerase/epimerase